ncbi:hypothetical protein I7I48_05413 [Histoplasma ohiense]|nr:hypothetical protein I7I48_05413 [Histoplasma ohiense (nom. inval.)]
MHCAAENQIRFVLVGGRKAVSLPRSQAVHVVSSCWISAKLRKRPTSHGFLLRNAVLRQEAMQFFDWIFWGRSMHTHTPRLHKR